MINFKCFNTYKVRIIFSNNTRNCITSNHQEALFADKCSLVLIYCSCTHSHSARERAGVFSLCRGGRRHTCPRPPQGPAVGCGTEEGPLNLTPQSIHMTMPGPWVVKDRCPRTSENKQVAIFLSKTQKVTIKCAV